MVEEADPLLARSPRARSRWTWKIGIAAMVIIGVVFAIAAANAGLRGEIGAAATLGKQPEGTGKKASVGLAAEARNAAAKTAAVGDDDADETAPAPAPANETVPANDAAPATAPAPSAAASADVADYEANAEAEPAKDTMAAVIEITVKNDETVTTAPGDTYTLFIHNSKTVAQLKARVKDLDGVPPERQILFFNGTRLEKDGKALREYDIETGDTVTVHHTSYWKKDA